MIIVKPQVLQISTVITVRKIQTKMQSPNFVTFLQIRNIGTPKGRPT